MAVAQSLFPDDRALGLITDFYELTMAAGYWSLGHNPRATFEGFVRTLPPNRPYLLTAGLEQAIHYLQHLHFPEDHIRWLKTLPAFKHVKQDFWDFLADFRFKGDVWAMPEGTVVFANEPLIRVTGTLLECQLLETYLLTAINFQTLVATKAARICREAGDAKVIEFGARRAHGPQSGLYAARASVIGGCYGTSNVYAAYLLGVPALGTQAHSWIMSFDSEWQAFKSYAEVYPENAICLIDTYNTLQGAHCAARLADKLSAVRLDSGNLLALGKHVREILDNAGLHHVKLIASSDLNEYTIHDLVADGAPFDFFGVGTDMVTSKDAPALSIVYKLVEIADPADKMLPVRKFSDEKSTLGGSKQVFRRFEKSGKMSCDVVGLSDEHLEGTPLLENFLTDGILVHELPSISAIRDYARNQLAQMPSHLHDLRGSGEFPISYSNRLLQHQQLFKKERTNEPL